MATTWKAQLTEQLEAAKTLSRSRWQTIRHILQTTLPPLWAEITAAAQELGSIGTNAISQSSQSLLTQIKTQAAAQIETLKTKSVDWDVKLEARYGDRYKIPRNAIGSIGEFYQSRQIVHPAPTPTNSGTTSTIEVPFQVIEEKAS
jgi:hypothetical protein